MPVSPTDFGQAPSGGLEAALVEHNVASRLFGEHADPVRVGRYTILQRIGAGGLGVVYAAHDPELQRRVALKVLQAPGDDRGRDGLLREAHALARIVHPNVITVHDAGTQGDEVFLAMELVPGTTLTDWLKTDRGWRDVLPLFLQAARGLAAAHDAGVVHGDFKPDNVVVGEDGRVRVLDFGLARVARAVGADGSRAGGTPAYMAPEQYLGWEVDGRADQFSFCVAMYEAVYGQRPFEGTDPQQILTATELGLPKIPEARVPRRLGRALARGLSSKPDDRWSSMHELLAQLEAARRPRLRRRWVIVAGAVGLAALLLPLLSPDDPCAKAEQQLADAWGEERRAAVDDALAAVDLSYAADVSARVVAELDRYAQRWVEQYRRACAASRESSDVPTDLRHRWATCIETRRTELAAAVEILANPDEVVVANAVQLVDRLAPPSNCAELERLGDRPQLEREEYVLALARAQAEGAAGRPRQAAELARGVVDAASSRGEDVARTRAQYELGVWLAAAGDQAAASEQLREAYFGARTADLESVAAQAAVELAWALLAEKQSPGHAEDWVRHARVSLVKQPDAYVRWRTSLVASGVAGASGDLEKAAKLGQECRESALGRGLWDAECLGQLGHTRSLQGRYEEALVAAREKHRALSDALPASHPRVAGALNDLGIVLDDVGRYEEAIQTHERALRGYAESLGPDSVKVGYALTNRGVSELNAGHFERAAQSLEQARAVLRAKLGERHPMMASVAVNLSAVYQLTDQPQASLEAVDAALEFAGTIPMEVGALHLSRAASLVQLDRAAEGVEAARRGNELVVEARGTEHREAARARAVLGRALLAAGDAKAAIAELGPAVARLREVGRDPKPIANAKLALARALQQLGRAPARVDSLTREAEAALAELERAEAD